MRRAPDGGEGLRVRTLARGTTARARAPYPLRGLHEITLTRGEVRALDAVRGREHPSAVLRDAVRRAAGLPPRASTAWVARPTRDRSRGTITLSREERTAVDRCRRDRDLTAWLRDAIRVGLSVGLPSWTPCADAALTKGFRRWSLVDLQRALPGRTPQAIWDHAVLVLGLSTELGGERLTLHAAAKRSGYHTRTLLRMLRAAGVEPEAMAWCRGNTHRARRVVKVVDVDRVVRERASLETVTDAAVRLGHDRGWLRDQLVRAGHAKPAGRVWRLPSAAFEEVSRRSRAGVAAP